MIYRRKDQEVPIDQLISSCNIAIDIYQLFKWVVLSVLWINGISSILSKMIISYLLFSNLFTYFYYHVWGSRNSQRTDRDTLNRKFLNTLIAISYYLFAYAYIYQIHFPDMISWANGTVDFVNAIYLSAANAFTLTYDGFAPKTQFIRIIFLSELITTFVFFTIIVTNSIPNHAGKEN